MHQKATLFSWLQRKLEAWKKPSEKSNIATVFCKRCFNEIRDDSWFILTLGSNSICSKCYRELNAKFIHFKVMGIKAISIYEYSQEIRSLLYQFKGCFDYELKDTFLEYLKPWLSVKYRGYSLICAPSSKKHNETRGFNHVAEMFKDIGLPIIEAISKNENRKQTEQNFAGRQRVGEILSWNDGCKIQGKKILFVDDVFTTGATCKACLRLIKKHHPRTIKVLVMSKTKQPNIEK